MIYVADGFNYIVRLKKGEKWSEGFAEFVAKTGVKSAWLNMVGGASQVTMGAYNLEQKQYLWKTFQGMLEIVTVQGNISLSETGEPMAHLHGTFANEDCQAFGGHIQDFTVSVTLEVFVHCLDQNTLLTRKFDPQIGLPLLDLPEGA
jgi:predicted DNA-binding protein with PD1-like motif